MRFLLLIFSFLSINSLAFSETNVKISKPQKIEFYKIINLPAESTALNGKNYYAPSNGFIDYIHDFSKKHFKKGELILAIDRDISDSQFKSAEASYNSNKLSFKRDKKLFDRKIISDEKLENAKVLLLNSKSKYQEIKKIYNNKVIYAPFDGIVSTANFKKGDRIMAGDFLSTISESNDKYIKFIIPSKIKINKSDARAFVRSKLDDSKYKLSNLHISNDINGMKEGYSSSGVINDENNLENNDYVDVEINYNIHQALSVPDNIVLNDEGKRYLFITNDNQTVKKIQIKQGDRVNNRVEIFSDEINENTSIITSGYQKLSDGQKISIIN